MPTYSYQCSTCNNEFEDFKMMNESGLTNECPKCKGMSTRIYRHAPLLKPFPGSVTYDRRNNFPPGTSAADYKGWAKDAKRRRVISDD
jgi:putative FmdB family regulatory protein